MGFKLLFEKVRSEQWGSTGGFFPRSIQQWFSRRTIWVLMWSVVINIPIKFNVFKTLWLRALTWWKSDCGDHNVEPGCGSSSYETYQGESGASWWSGVGVLLSSLIPFRPQKNNSLKYRDIGQKWQHLRESEICCLMSDELPLVSEEWCDVWLQPRGWVTAASSLKVSTLQTTRTS